MLCFIQTLPRIIVYRCKNIGSPPITESSLSIDNHGVKRDLDKKHWYIPYHLTQSSMGARTLNLGDSVFLYTGAISRVSFSDLFGPIYRTTNPQGLLPIQNPDI